jgi:glycosyltransferase involved in cell wall biosynthesis
MPAAALVNASHAERAAKGFVLAAFCGDEQAGWLPSLINLRGVVGQHSLRVFARTNDIEAGLGDTEVVPDLRELLASLAEDASVDWIVVAGRPCLAPGELLTRLADVSDERVATVSFLSNAANALSFPFVGTEVPWTVEGYSPDELTRRLRSFSPWSRGADGWEEGLTNFALAAQARGLLNVLDSTTFVQRAADLQGLSSMSLQAQERLDNRFPWYRAALDASASDPCSPLRLEHELARIKVSGLDILLDGSCLGPTEMGTQVGLLSIAESLADREDVSSVTITVPQALPSYAHRLSVLSKISFVRAAIGQPIDSDRTFDVAFRPFQPDETFDARVLRQRARRVIVSLLDLIAYQNGSYFSSGDSWMQYRAAIRASLGEVDAITTISHDVVSMVALERLAIAPDRVYPVPYGTEHVDGSAPSRMPQGFDSLPGARFLVTLGTNYGHKNRDIAIRCLEILRARGHDLKLILVGPAVPYGSSRALEAEALGDLKEADVVFMSNVSSMERNWLLSHAEVVLYPTSAEGFGLVPYEAALLGTPTIFVPFGPLAEIAGGLPIEARDWSPASFADQVERLLRDPGLGTAQVDALRAASLHHSWAATAEELCQVFRSVLSKAPAT